LAKLTNMVLTYSKIQLQQSKI